MDSPHRFDIRELLARCGLFAGLPPQLLGSCAEGALLLDFPRGSLLIRQGDAADSAFIIAEGTAEVVLEKPDGTEDLIDILSVGDCVGDLAIVLDQPRTASVRAVRNCRAVRIDRADFIRLQATVPEFSVSLTRTVAQRLQRTTRQRVRKRQVTDIVAIVQQTTAATDRTLEALAAALARLPGIPARLHTTHTGDVAQFANRLADADVALILADAATCTDGAAVRRALDIVQTVRPRPQTGLLLCHGQSIAPGSLTPCLQDPRFHSHYHARSAHSGDFGRIARLLTGQAIGVALSGGGARGFAHIGVLRALAEAGVPIDYVAGTSMGAIIAAQFAADFAIDAMVAATRRGYVEQKGLPDFAFPSVALYSGRATDRKLKAMFGERMIEDLPIPYFAVAADLRRAESVVLDRGPVWRAARISTSIPGMLPPTEQDGRLLVDGGLLDNLPVEALRQRCGGRIVASDVSVAVEFDDPPSPGLWPKSQPSPARPGIAQIMMRTAQLASIRDSREAGIPADLYLNPQLTDVGMSDFGRFDEIVERGVIHARQLLEGWKA